MKKIALLIYTFSMLIHAQNVKVTSGKIERIENFKSQFVDPRNVDVWLPDGYSDKEKYAVLYMQDGQMLFDPQITWNKQAWKVDEVAGKLIANNEVQKFIVVGIWNNTKKRHPEYFPEKPYQSLNQVQKDTISAQLHKKERKDDAFIPISDLYLKFLITELKPFIDKNFSTKTDRKHTFIAGSSMDGLISLYAICEYPKVFGGAACMSTHWTGTYSPINNPIPEAFFNYLKENLPNPKTHKIYFDYGNKTLDAMYKPFQEKVDIIMEQKGYTANNWETKFFPGDDHSENSWHNRIHIPLEFLLTNK